MMCFAVSSGTITDAMVEGYIAEQEGEPVHDDGQFLIDDFRRPFTLLGPILKI
jgi:hypothetical protein